MEEVRNCEHNERKIFARGLCNICYKRAREEGCLQRIAPVYFGRRKDKFAGESPMLGKLLNPFSVQRYNTYKSTGLARIRDTETRENAILECLDTERALMQLEERERKVVQMLAEEFEICQIADELKCSVRTVNNIVQVVRWKLYGRKPESQIRVIRNNHVEGEHEAPAQTARQAA